MNVLARVVCFVHDVKDFVSWFFMRFKTWLLIGARHDGYPRFISDLAFWVGITSAIIGWKVAFFVSVGVFFVFFLVKLWRGGDWRKWQRDKYRQKAMVITTVKEEEILK